MRSRLITLLISMIVLSAFLVPTSPIYPKAAGAGTPAIGVTSDTFGHNLTSLSQLGSGLTFTVYVNVTNAGALGGFEVTLNYVISLALPASSVPIVVQSGTLNGGLFDPSQTFSNPNCKIIPTFADVLPIVNRIHFGAVVRGGCTEPGDGNLFYVTFLVTGVGATSIDIVQGADAGGSQKLQIISGVAPHPLIPVKVYSAYFRNKAGIPPHAGFGYAPRRPLTAQSVNFNTNSSVSFDPYVSPGPGISKYIWEWGDNEPPSQGASLTNPSHVFKFSPTVFATGTFQVKLVVVDSDDQLPSEAIQLVTVTPPILHDLAVTISADKNQPNVGDTIKVTVTAYNRGTQTENANLTTWYDAGPTGITILGQNSSFVVPVTHNPSFNYTLATANLSPRSYTISAHVQLLGYPDDNPLDDDASYSFTLVGTGGSCTGGLACLSVPLVAGLSVAALAVIGTGVYLVRRRGKEQDSLE